MGNKCIYTSYFAKVQLKIIDFANQLLELSSCSGWRTFAEWIAEKGKFNSLWQNQDTGIFTFPFLIKISCTSPFSFFLICTSVFYACLSYANQSKLLLQFNTSRRASLMSPYTPTCYYLYSNSLDWIPTQPASVTKKYT